MISEELLKCLEQRHLLAYDVFTPEEGGDLTFDGEESGVVLHVPPGAVTKPQLIYMMVMLDDTDGSPVNMFAPTIACGPNGTKFQVLSWHLGIILF